MGVGSSARTADDYRSSRASGLSLQPVNSSTSLPDVGCDAEDGTTPPNDSFYDCDEELSPRSVGGQQTSSRCGCARRHWKVLAVATVLLMITFVTAYIYIPTYVVQSRLNGADISLERALLEITSETSNLVKPRAHLFVPQSLMYVPLLSYTAEMQPFEGTVFVYVDGPPPSGADHPSQVPVELGRLVIPQKLTIRSGSDVNVRVEGVFRITSPQYLGPAVSRFISEKVVPATLTAKVDVLVKAWGWLPMYFSGVSVSYTEDVRAFDNFRTHPITLDEVNTAVGQPKRLDVGCSAYVYNPSPFSMHVADNVSMRVLYNWTGSDVEVGMLYAQEFKINPGMNIANGTFSIRQTPHNNDVIVDMITAYVGGVQTGFGPSARKPFFVTVADAGAATAKSELVRTALKDLRVTMNFRPKPLFLLLDVTADVVIGGSIVHWPPAFYQATVNLRVKNPLPDTARIEKVYVKAHSHNLSGPLLYNFNRDSEDLPKKYVVPPLADTWLSFRLFLSEAAVPTDLEEIFKLAKEATHAKLTVGVDVELHVIVDNGYHQQVNYKNDKVSAVICYNVVIPSQICKGKTSLPASSAIPEVPLHLPTLPEIPQSRAHFVRL